MSVCIDWGTDFSTPFCDNCDTRAEYKLDFSFGSIYMCSDCVSASKYEVERPTECDFCGEEMYDPDYISEAFLIAGYHICEDCVEEGRI